MNTSIFVGASLIAKAINPTLFAELNPYLFFMLVIFFILADVAGFFIKLSSK